MPSQKQKNMQVEGVGEGGGVGVTEPFWQQHQALLAHRVPVLDTLEQTETQTRVLFTSGAAAHYNVLMRSRCSWVK